MNFRRLRRLSQSPSLLICGSSGRYQGELAFARFALEKNFELYFPSWLTEESLKNGDTTVIPTVCNVLDKIVDQ